MHLHPGAHGRRCVDGATPTRTCTRPCPCGPTLVRWSYNGKCWWCKPKVNARCAVRVRIRLDSSLGSHLSPGLPHAHRLASRLFIDCTQPPPSAATPTPPPPPPPSPLAGVLPEPPCELTRRIVWRLFIHRYRLRAPAGLKVGRPTHSLITFYGTGDPIFLRPLRLRAHSPPNPPTHQRAASGSG